MTLIVSDQFLNPNDSVVAPAGSSLYLNVYFDEDVGISVFYFIDNTWRSYALLDDGFVLGSPSLTFLGYVSLVGVGLALCFLFIGVISNFLKNRG